MPEKGKYEGIGESRYFESDRESGVDAVQGADVDADVNVDEAWTWTRTWTRTWTLTWTWTWGGPRENGSGGEEKVRSKDGDISAAKLNGQ
jgi:hypothetical protein